MYTIKPNQTGEDKDKQIEKTSEVVQIIVPANLLEQIKQIDKELEKSNTEIKVMEEHKKPLELKKQELENEIKEIKKETKLNF